MGAPSPQQWPTHPQWHSERRNGFSSSDRDWEAAYPAAQPAQLGEGYREEGYQGGGSRKDSYREAGYPSDEPYRREEYRGGVYHEQRYFKDQPFRHDRGVRGQSEAAHRGTQPAPHREGCHAGQPGPHREGYGGHGPPDERSWSAPYSNHRTSNPGGQSQDPWTATRAAQEWPRSPQCHSGELPLMAGTVW